MQNKKDLGALDLFRLVAAALVVFIHSPAVPALGESGNLLLSGTFARLAVPFFFAVTGMFTDFTSAEKVKRLLIKTLILYAAATAVYLPYGTYHSTVKQILFDGTFYHLWYLPALITGALTVFALKKLPVPAAFGIAAVLYAFGLCGDSYLNLARNIPVINSAMDFLTGIFSYTRNGIFFAPLFLLIGNIIGNSIEDMPRRPMCVFIYAVCLMLSLGAFVFERFSLKEITFTLHDNMFISLIPCVSFLMLTLTSIRIRPVPSLRGISMWIYIIHPIIIDLVIRLTNKAADGSITEDARGAISKAAVSVVTAGAYVFVKYLKFPNNKRAVNSRNPAAPHTQRSGERF